MENLKTENVTVVEYLLSIIANAMLENLPMTNTLELEDLPGVMVIITRESSLTVNVMIKGRSSLLMEQLSLEIGGIANWLATQKSPVIESKSSVARSNN
jgi:hypothetical protein